MNVSFFNATRQYEKIRPEIEAAVARVLKSGKYILGDEGAAFEDAFKNHSGARYAIGVNSGTDALKIALAAFSIGAGDEVITVSNTAVPTVSAIREAGATPVFVDINLYFTIDTALVEKAITSKTKAIIAVHLYGQMADMAALAAIAKKHGLKLIEDCAQAAGATIKSAANGTSYRRNAGNIGDAGCFSFYPTKNLGAYGDGGMILTNDQDVFERARQIRMYGMKRSYYSEMDGFNSRLDEIQAAILAVKLPHLDEWNAKRKAIAEYYAKHVKNPLIELPRTRDESEHIFHLFVIRTKERKAFMEYLQKNGIGCGIHYEFPIHTQPPYRAFAPTKYGLPESELAAKEIVSLPIFPELEDAELEYIAEKLNQFGA